MLANMPGEMVQAGAPRNLNRARIPRRLPCPKKHHRRVSLEPLLFRSHAILADVDQVATGTRVALNYLGCMTPIA